MGFSVFCASGFADKYFGVWGCRVMGFRASGPKMYDSEMLRGCSVIRNNILREI